MLAELRADAKILASPIPAFIVKEIREALPAILFFAVGFNLVVLTTQLILDDYAAQFAGFMVATMAALLVGKAVLVAKVLPFFRRFDNAPLDSADPVQNGRVLGRRVPGAIPGKADRVFSGWGSARRRSGICDDPFHLASLCRDPDLDLRTFPYFCRCGRTEHVVRTWRAVQNLLHSALVRTETNPASTGSQAGRSQPRRSRPTK